MAHSTSTVYPFVTLGSEFKIHPVVLELSMKAGHDHKGEPKKNQSFQIFCFCAINANSSPVSSCEMLQGQTNKACKCF